MDARTVQELATLFVRCAGGSAEVHCRQEAVRATEMMRSYCDNTDAWEALRWLPAMPLEEGLRRTAEYLLGRHMPLPAPGRSINWVYQRPGASGGTRNEWPRSAEGMNFANQPVPSSRVRS